MRYQLLITQEMLSAGGQELEGLKRVTGSGRVVDGSRELFAEEGLVLHLQDGRTLPFFVATSGRGTFDITASGQMTEAKESQP